MTTMKLDRKVLITCVTLILASAIFRFLGLGPQIALAVFAGAIIKDKKWSFALPLFSMMFSDLLFEIAFKNGWTQYGGIYDGQLVNYILLISTTAFGFLIHKEKMFQSAFAILAAPTFYFLASNIAVWIGGGGWSRPQTSSGLLQSLIDGLPFYKNSMMTTIAFSALFFGGYALLFKKEMEKAKV
jgi:hypothetical protein